MAATIYLHWAATPYSWHRNSNSVALSCACIGGRPDPWSIPPTAVQREALCQEAAAIARSWGWSAADITIQRLMTHAEAASNRDGPAWCRALEFAEEFQITASFETFALRARHGG